MNNLKDLVQIISMIIGLITIMWTIYSGLRTYKDNSINRKQEQLSNAIKQFSDNNIINKYSALAMITNNIDLIYDEMFLISGLENDRIIRKLLEESLCNAGKKTLLRGSKFNYDYLNILCELRMFSKIDTYIIPWYVIEFFITNKKEFDLNIEITNEKRKFDDMVDYDLHIKQAMRYIVLSSSIIACALASHRKILQFNTKLIVFANLYKSRITKLNVNTCFFYSCIMRHMQVKKSKINKSNYIKCDLFDCDLNRINIKNVKIVKANLIQSNIRRGKIDELEINSSVHSKASIIESELSNIKSINVNYNGCNFEESTLTNSIFKNCSFNGASFLNCNMSNVRFWGIKVDEKNKKLHKNELCGCYFKECTLNNISFNGAILSGAIFENCCFDNVDFSGAFMKNVKFIYRNQIENINLTKAHEIESIMYIKK